MATWTIKGEAGKAFNATARSFETLRVQGATLKFQSLADDSLVWTAVCDYATGAGTVVPEEGQVIELFRDGVRKFRGHATRPRVGFKSVQVEVLGPWWWMTKVYLTSVLTDGTGATDERGQYVFPEGALDGMIEDLIDRGITNGVPMLRGSVAAMYDVTQLTLSNMSIAAALGRMIQRVPDAVAWFDYSGSSGDLPTLKVARRGGADAMTADTYTVGTDKIEMGDIYPRLDLEVSRVELKYVDRHPDTGKVRFKQQASGTAVTGKLQMVTVSGPEIVDFLPQDEFDSIEVQTVLWTAITSAFVKARDGGLASIEASIGGVFGAVGLGYAYYTGTTGTGGVKIYHFVSAPGLTRKSDTGVAFPTATKYLVISPDPLPEWAQTELGAIAVTISGSWIAEWRDSEVGVGTGWSDVFVAMQAGAQFHENGWENSMVTGSTSDYRVDSLARPFSVTGYLIDTAFASLTTVYKPWKYTFAEPPAGMAAGLKVAQNWVPWEGPFTLAADEVTGNNLLNKAVNINGAFTACETMGALAKSVSHDLVRKRTVITLGAPARIDFGTAVGRVPSSPQDIIEYIS